MIFYLIVFASVCMFGHLMFLLALFVKKDAYVNENISVLRGGRRIGAQNESADLLKEFRDHSDTVVRATVGAHSNVTSNFRGFYIRLYDMNSGQYYDAYLDRLIQIGRVGSGSDIDINDQMVSSKHCTICRKGNEILVQDLGSKNHTFVNECMIEFPLPLSYGDNIHIGSHVYQFQFFDIQR